LHVAKPERLTDDELLLHIARVKWLLQSKYIYGIEAKFDSVGWQTEEEVIEQLNKELE
jgi:hypothetical protein